ncbi:MAG: DUF5106 domain-containing protein [Bacteroidota bacterium]|nr:DUF5106 domain-containing protein [Bacteroidota bacterium]
MKKLLPLIILLVSFSALAQDGYEIRITFKPFKNQYIYLGHYYGKQLPIIDSALLNDKSEAVFKGNKRLGGGIYLVGYPNKTGFFEILIDREQKFSVIADTTNLLNAITFQNSNDNALFNNYQKFMQVNGREIDNALKQRQLATTLKDSVKWNEVINKINKTIQQYRDDEMKKNPSSMLTFLLTAMREPEVPAKEKQPGAKYDSAFAYRYYKDHFWDGINFFDERLSRTPFFETKLDKYFEQVVYQHPDSINKEIDWMLGYASVNEEMQKFLLLKFINHYLNQKYMWEDAVFVHLFEKYLAQKNYTWMTEKGRKTITDRAYSLMANIFGTPASDIDLPDSSGKNISLYSIPAPYVVVFIFDPTCGHCKETAPKLDSFYQSKWKAMGLKIYAMAKETDGNKTDWLKFIKELHLNDWTNVYYSKAADKARIDAGIPGYSQLYDVLTFPTLYLLDKDKRIIAKKLTYQQIDEVLQFRMQTK